MAGHLNGDNLTAEMIQQLALDTNVTYDLAGKRARLNSFQVRSPNFSA